MKDATSPFEWDPAKDRENLRKHGVSFETASLIFEDPWILSNMNPSHEDSEGRFRALGEIAPGLVLFVAFTWRARGTDRRRFD
jgi:uncharacterized protein